VQTPWPLYGNYRDVKMLRLYLVFLTCFVKHCFIAYLLWEPPTVQTVYSRLYQKKAAFIPYDLLKYFAGTTQPAAAAKTPVLTG
jgi:hypothetical protein